MRIRSVLFILFVLLLLSASLTAASPNSAESIFRAAAEQACVQRGVSDCSVVEFNRTQLAHNIAYYHAVLKVGAGEHDLIGINHLIREAKPEFPVSSVGTFFFVPGSSATFYELMVMPKHNAGLGVFLAESNVDVWGIDQRNVQIPSTVTDVSFAANWGEDVQIQDLRIALRTARMVRGLLSRQDAGAIILGGHSSGAMLTFAMANTEAVLPAEDKDISAIVPMDGFYVLPPEMADTQQFLCYVADYYASVAGSGMGDNSFLISVNQLARSNPNDVSPFDSTVTNQQYALGIASSTFWYPLFPFHPFSIVFNDAGIPVDGRYSSIAEIVDDGLNVPFYPVPNAFSADTNRTACLGTSGPYANHLGDVTVPVLYVGAAGGFGRVGEYTLTLLGSKDVTSVMIQLQGDNDGYTDWGHMDPFTADRAPQLVWQPMHAWLVKHSH